MNLKKFDIVIIGSGLSSYSALKYLIYKKVNLEKKICIITGRNLSKKHNLDDCELKYLKKSHKVIYDNGNLSEINSENFTYFKNNKLNLISLNSLGGLGKFWGGGFFPSEYFLKDKIIKKKILSHFKYKKSEIKNYFKIKKSDSKNIIEMDCKFLVSSKNKNKILNPGDEIKDICKENNISFIDYCFVTDFKYKNNSKKFEIYLNNKNMVSTNNLLLAAGAINTPYLLYKSGIINNKYLLVKDHAMYRIPLFRPTQIIKVLINFLFGKKIKKKITISSLKQAFKLNISKRSIFLGLYALSIDKIKLPFLLKLLVEYEIIIFSQLYVSNEDKEFSCKISMDYDDKVIVNNPKYLKLKELKYILFFYLRNKMIPIPYQYKLPFGSSYHFYGSLVSPINKLKIVEKVNNKIFVIDNSNLDYIGCEPSSYGLIQNTYKQIDKFIEKINMKRK